MDGIAAKFGFVGEASITLGQDNSNILLCWQKIYILWFEIPGKAKVLTVMLQIYVEISADGAGFGIFMALCSPNNPKWEIVPGMINYD